MPLSWNSAGAKAFVLKSATQDEIMEGANINCTPEDDVFDSEFGKAELDGLGEHGNDNSKGGEKWAVSERNNGKRSKTVPVFAARKSSRVVETGISMLEKASNLVATKRLENPDMASPINFNQFLEKEKLKSNGSNFTDWFRHVRIFLNGGNLQYVLDAPLGDPPAETETDEVKNVYATRKTRYSQVQCAILCSLEADLQKRFEHHDPHELINELKTIFETHAAVECYEASKHFFDCMMEEGSSVSEHMLAMTGHAKKLELPELFAMLKSAEIEIKKEHQVLMVNKTTSFKNKSKGKNKKSGKKAATPPVKPKTGPKPDAECYYCKEKGH
ncbi:hypothetical protein QYE76_036000 [Lolium multiflorum]|uniref:Uncharacterized protein n=1 Tax=Lolium multiflorum TaxID=4521 RepID=A0AAD8R1Y5_LOLMU|nr:hypothetical protein QYE76_036000 [Lolium multiflorum]